jgi:hypothetical protein
MPGEARPLTPLQRAALDAALCAPLKKFPVGWAHGRAGPFHRHCSVLALAAKGLLRIGWARGGARCRVVARASAARRPRVGRASAERRPPVTQHGEPAPWFN